MLKYKLTNKVNQKYLQIDYTAVQKVQLSNVYVGRLMCWNYCTILTAEHINNMKLSVKHVLW